MHNFTLIKKINVGLVALFCATNLYPNHLITLHVNNLNQHILESSGQAKIIESLMGQEAAQNFKEKTNNLAQDALAFQNTAMFMNISYQPKQVINIGHLNDHILKVIEKLQPSTYFGFITLSEQLTTPLKSLIDGKSADRKKYIRLFLKNSTLREQLSKDLTTMNEQMKKIFDTNIIEASLTNGALGTTLNALFGLMQANTQSNCLTLVPYMGYYLSYCPYAIQAVKNIGPLLDQAKNIFTGGPFSQMMQKLNNGIQSIKNTLKSASNDLTVDETDKNFIKKIMTTDLVLPQSLTVENMKHISSVYRKIGYIDSLLTIARNIAHKTAIVIHRTPINIKKSNFLKQKNNLELSLKQVWTLTVDTTNPLYVHSMADYNLKNFVFVNRDDSLDHTKNNLLWMAANVISAQTLGIILSTSNKITSLCKASMSMPVIDIANMVVMTNHFHHSSFLSDEYLASLFFPITPIEIKQEQPELFHAQLYQPKLL